ncbi:MAG: class I SAM-dependent methyltransferase [Candidatus Aminicenantes bacterium]|nr:class I SAM-dependent methyltransferase [Candidatus Aminicenantes bacterium]
MAKLSSYRLSSTWDRIGRSLPAFIGAPSTRYYLECERLLLSQYFPDLKKGRRLLKTDLWDEAKNSQILFWVVEQGSEGYGIDISPAIASEARANLARIKKRPARAGLIVSDVRNIATADNSFDYLYSMGTIEHFAEYRQAIRECYRVLRPGGLAIIGVPNKLDPFLRPLLVSLLRQLNLYYYGQEKAFSAKELKGMLEEAGFEVVATSGILFLPGWLRMLDLAIHVKWPAASFLMAPLIRPFSRLYRKFPFLRRNGYLIACVGKK